MQNVISQLKDKEIQSKVLQVKELALMKIDNDCRLKDIFNEIKNSNEELYIHSILVADISCILGVLFNFRLDELMNLYFGALYHDNGKTLLNSEVLYKPDVFSADERQLAESHTSLGRKQIGRIIDNKDVLDIILKHHERIDGTGYPIGISEKEQSIFVRIVAVADVFNALTSQRCYKESMSEEQAFEILEKDKGLDQTVVYMLKKISM